MLKDSEYGCVWVVLLQCVCHDPHETSVVVGEVHFRRVVAHIAPHNVGVNLVLSCPNVYSASRLAVSVTDEVEASRHGIKPFGSGNVHSTLVSAVALRMQQNSRSDAVGPVEVGRVAPDVAQDVASVLIVVAHHIVGVLDLVSVGEICFSAIGKFNVVGVYASEVKKAVERDADS